MTLAMPTDAACTREFERLCAKAAALGVQIVEDRSPSADTRFTASVTVCASVTIGERCIVHPGVVIGGDGFGFAPDRGTWVKVPQLGSVRIV